MDDDGGDDDLQQTMGFTSEDFSELNDIINLTTTSSIEEISELYKSFNTTSDNGDNIEKEMPKVQKVESTRLKSLLNEEFSTRQKLLDRVRNVAVMEGYVTVIKRSKADRKVVIGCDRGGKFRGTSVPMDERKKISATRLISCPFEMVGLKRVGDYVWALERFRRILGNDQQPLVILSDRELALMNAIHLVFPGTAHILCVWHIEKNVLSKCKSQFDKGEDWETFLSTWTNLIESPDESSFNEAWHLIEAQYKEKEYVLNYLKNIWLPFKERFVNAWTSKHPHFGNRVTSRVEGAHAMLKKYLTVSTGNFREVREKICLAIDNQYNEIKTKIASEKLRATHKFAHMMREKKDGTLHLDDVHPQWRIDIRSFINTDGGVQKNGSEIECLLKNVHDKYKHMPLVQKEDIHKQIAQLVDVEIPLTLEPNIQPHKGRLLGSKKRKGDCSTTRHASAFEIVEKGRKCGVCHRVGHNSRSCPHKGEFNSSDPHFVLANQDVTLNMLETPLQYEISTSLEL